MISEEAKRKKFHDMNADLSSLDNAIKMIAENWESNPEMMKRVVPLVQAKMETVLQEWETIKNILRNATAVLLCTLFVSGTASASPADKMIDDLKEKLRPWMEQNVGMEWTDRLLGTAPVLVDDVVLPAIPKVKRDAKSVEVYSRKEDASGKSIKMTKDQIRNSNINFVREVFMATRGAAVSNEDMNRWMNVLEQGGAREAIYRGLVLDDVYGGLENFNKQMTQGNIAFAMRFAARYLGAGYSKEQLSKVDLFSAKRIIAEKSLEVFDELMDKNRDDAYSWYAVMSADLAQVAGDWWKEPLRKDISKKQHKHWASTVPDQYIKSEIVLKIHYVMNLMNER